MIDLRNNPGGLLTSVCDVLGWILPEGLIVYTEDKYGNKMEEMCDGKHPLDMPLAVLVNEGSASASEIFAGAAQDTVWERWLEQLLSVREWYRQYIPCLTEAQ